jgi:hypothetical protein
LYLINSTLFSYSNPYPPAATFSQWPESYFNNPHLGCATKK